MGRSQRERVVRRSARTQRSSSVLVQRSHSASTPKRYLSCRSCFNPPARRSAYDQRNVADDADPPLRVTHSGYRRARNFLSGFLAAVAFVFGVQVLRFPSDGTVVAVFGLFAASVACFVLFPAPWAELTDTALRRGSKFTPATETPLSEIEDVIPRRHGPTLVIRTEQQRSFPLAALNRQFDLWGADPRVETFEVELRKRIKESEA